MITKQRTQAGRLKSVINMTKIHHQQMSLASKTSESAEAIKTETSCKSPMSSISDNSQQDGEDFRGRRQDRDRSTTAKEEEDSGDDQGSGAGTSGNGKPRKRKRSRKGLDKNFPCPHQGCGKSYSRAEHLYRHQLNRKLTPSYVSGQYSNSVVDTPKKIYTCDFPSCNRQFVRQDLCTRHRERHTARGSHLQRKEPYGHEMDARPVMSPTAGYREPHDSFRSPMGLNGGSLAGVPHANVQSYASPMGLPSLPGRMSESQQPRPHSATAGGGHLTSPASYRSPTGSEYGSIAPLQRSNSDDQYYNNNVYRNYDPPPTARSVPNTGFDMGQRQTSSNADQRRHQTMTDMRGTRSTPHSMPAPAAWSNPPNPNFNLPNATSYTSNYPVHNGGTSGSYTPNQNFAPSSFSLPPPLVSPANQNTSQINMSTATSAPTPFDTSNNVNTPGSNTVDTTMSDRGSFPYPVPAYNSDSHSRSPYAMADDFTAWLFSDPNLSKTSSNDFHPGTMPFGPTHFGDYQNPMSYADYPQVGGPLSVESMQPLPPQNPMAVNSMLDSSQNADILSKEKWAQLLDLISQRFNETDHAPVRKQKEDLLEGDREDRDHVLSQRMMETYIGSYWYHFHPQLPILHKPTFSADKTPNLLLIAVIAIGASCLDKVHGPQITQNGAELSNFLAWHLRGELFKEKDFTPPAKLWVFQALLLLEVYEKMYSTRTLHERAHVFHGSTLTLIRRGNALIGRSPCDSPPPVKEENFGLSANGVKQDPISHTPDEWWNKWITNEATRRMVFAAFIIDNLHATMFGHTVTMVAHEMKLQLPCDESLWSATSSADVSRIEAGLVARGIKSITFFDGLKWTLTGQSVRTNPFGRTALMAGLLNVSWHMNQRDVQVRALQPSTSLGGRARWRGNLTRAFDFWKDDFEQSGSKDSAVTSTVYSMSNRLDEENIFESKTVLHHLAHMAMHVDVVSCQVFANAKRLLGRTTLQEDYASAQKRIREHWAPKASARDATFYSLKFLQKVLVPDAGYPQRNAGDSGNGVSYSARDDFLLNRPWVLYFAALIVWSYGYALDGPITKEPDMATTEQQVYDMRKYLATVGGVQTPDDLAHLRDRNACLGMLYILRSMFDKCRWELLHEAATLMTNCIEMLKGDS